MSIINEATDYLKGANKKRKDKVAKKVFNTIKEKSEKQQRLEGLVNQKDLGNMNKALSSLVIDLLEEGFEFKDVDKFVTSLFKKALKGIYKTNKDLVEGVDYSLEELDEALVDTWQAHLSEAVHNIGKAKFFANEKELKLAIGDLQSDTKERVDGIKKEYK